MKSWSSKKKAFTFKLFTTYVNSSKTHGCLLIFKAYFHMRFISLKGLLSLFYKKTSKILNTGSNSFVYHYCCLLKYNHKSESFKSFNISSRIFTEFNHFLNSNASDDLSADFS